MDISVIGVLDDQEILLDIAALALSQLDHAECDVGAYLAQLEAIEDRVCLEGRGATLSSEQAIVLAEVLHDELGFAGDQEGYDARRGECPKHVPKLLHWQEVRLRIGLELCVCRTLSTRLIV